MNKGEMMKLVYSSYELKSIDTAIPKEYWDGKNKDIQLDPTIHVMNYNKPNEMGILQNMEDVAKERMIDLEKGLDKETILARCEGYPDKMSLLTAVAFSSVVPGICTNGYCNYTTDVEPDATEAWCESCNTKSIQSIHSLMGM